MKKWIPDYDDNDLLHPLSAGTAIDSTKFFFILFERVTSGRWCDILIDEGRDRHEANAQDNGDDSGAGNTVLCADCRDQRDQVLSPL